MKNRYNSTMHPDENFIIFHNNLSKELQLLILLCNEKLTIDEYAYLHNFLPAITNNIDKTKHLYFFIRKSKEHGVLSIIYHSLKKYLPSVENTLHKEVMSHMQSEYLTISKRNMLMTAELIKIMRIFEENTIDALPFKGPALASFAYCDITMRQYVDLDFLIKKKDIECIVNLLYQNGYKPLYNIEKKQESIWYKYAKDMVFIHSEKHISAEMHWLLLDEDYPVQFDVASLWKAPETVEINRHIFQTFPHDSLLVYLCIHGSKHLWERLIWIKDIDRMVRTKAPDWQTVSEQIDNEGYGRMLLLGLFLSHCYFHTPLPPVIEQKTRTEKWLLSLQRFIEKRWMKPQCVFAETAAMLHLFPSLKLKLRYLHKVILKPAKNEYRFVDLPEKHYWFYYLIRPYLLLKKYLLPHK